MQNAESVYNLYLKRYNRFEQQVMEVTNMGVYNSDWLLNQIRGTANVVSKAFKFETLDIDLGQVEDEQGHTVDGVMLKVIKTSFIPFSLLRT